MCEERNDSQQKIISTAVSGYANYLRVSHSFGEFILEFHLMEEHQAENIAKIVINPIYIKDFVKVIQNNIEKYEKRLGIELPENPNEFLQKGITKK
ncbi:MAG: DUF3467 domain-containing protein [Halanaerobiales bacterium]|nr:DUF3467 domain-containing protein [Halanaerobiales bacterium]